ncbi:MAG: iron ABC transporter permease [archaeon]|nr:iron ABC transporter permease [archaeon]
MVDFDEKYQDYRRFVWRRVSLILVCLVLIVVMGGLALSIGQRSIPFLDVYDYVIKHLQGVEYEFGSEPWWDDYVIWNVRLPRAIIAIVAGAGLSVAGTAMQSLMKNPLADPYTTGVSSAAVFGVTIAMVMGFTVTNGGYGIVFNAFLFGLIPAVLMIVISKFTNVSPATLILTGVAISYLFGSMSTVVMTTADSQSMAAAYVWQIGSLQDLSWESVPTMAVVVTAGTVVLASVSEKLNIMTLGDASAKSLGVDPDNFRLICLVISSLMVASIISFTGILGFVGLVVPHIVRQITGSDNRFVILGSAVFGGLFLLIVDNISKCVVLPDELPVGIIMSFIGAPIFLYLILKTKKEVW